MTRTRARRDASVTTVRRDILFLLHCHAVLCVLNDRYCVDSPSGYTGADCTKQEGEDLNYSPALLGLIITLFVIVCALAAGLLFMVRQIAAYKEDMAHYEVLKGEDESSHGVVV